MLEHRIVDGIGYENFIHDAKRLFLFDF